MLFCRRERREQEAAQKEKEKQELDRLERERAEKQRAAEQAVHKHFEESLRLAQQKVSPLRHLDDTASAAYQALPHTSHQPPILAACFTQTD